MCHDDEPDVRPAPQYSPQHVVSISHATGGSTAVTFALAFIPIVGLTGMAIDCGRASAVRSAMQAAADVRDVKVDPVTNASASWIECGDAGDNRQDLTCTNIKNAGIRIYAIQVNTSSPPDPTPTLLQNCATRPSSFG